MGADKEPLTEISETQAHFSSINAAKDVFNKVSSGQFFNTTEMEEIVTETDASQALPHESAEAFKNEQKFGHILGSDAAVQTVSEKVSTVLKNNSRDNSICSPAGAALHASS